MRIHQLRVFAVPFWVLIAIQNVVGHVIRSDQRAGGIERRTHKMMQQDLESACRVWLKEAPSPQEQEAREKSDFLAHANHAGRFADFHSCRHLFITSLERAGIRPLVAQTLARHSDIRFTLNVFTHAVLADKTAAIGILPGPPAAKSC